MENKTAFIKVPMTPTMRKQLDELAEARNIKATELMRLLIEKEVRKNEN